jgi:hypothetical protein
MEPVGRPAARGRSRAPGSPQPQADSPSLWTAHRGHGPAASWTAHLGDSPAVSRTGHKLSRAIGPRNWAAHKLGCASRPGTSWAAQAGQRKLGRAIGPRTGPQRGADSGVRRGDPGVPTDRKWSLGWVTATAAHRWQHRYTDPAKRPLPVRRYAERATTPPNRPTRLSPPGPMPGSSTDSGFESRQPTKKPSADQRAASRPRTCLPTRDRQPTESRQPTKEPPAGRVEGSRRDSLRRWGMTVRLSDVLVRVSPTG